MQTVKASQAMLVRQMGAGVCVCGTTHVGNKYTTANAVCLSEPGVLLVRARDKDVVRATVMDSLEGPGVAVTVRLEVLWSQYGAGLKHLHEHHVTHHPEQTCTDDKNFIRHRCMKQAHACVSTHVCVCSL